MDDCGLEIFFSSFYLDNFVFDGIFMILLILLSV